MAICPGLDVEKNLKEKEEKKKVPKIWEIFSEVKSVHNFCKIPRTLNKKIKQVLFWVLLTTVVSRVLVFSLEGAKAFASKGNMLMTLTLLAIYIVRDAFTTAIKNASEQSKQHFDMCLQKHQNNVFANIALKVKGKCIKNGNVMQDAIIQETVGNYIKSLYSLRRSLASTVIDIMVLSISFVATLLIVFKGNNLKVSLTIMAIILLLFILYIVCDRKYQEFTLKNDKERLETRKKSRNAQNDMLNQTIMDQGHYRFLQNSYMVFETKCMELDFKKQKERNKVELVKELLSSAFIIIAVLLYVFNSGYTDLMTMLISILAFYAIIMSLINGEKSILRNCSYLKEGMIYKRNNASDFKLILNAYDKENNKKLKSVQNGIITIPKYKYENDAFSLNIKNELEIEKGKLFLLDGDSGTGKSTLIDIITGEKGDIGYNVKAIKYHNGMKLGSSNVLSEIILDKPLNKEKLFEILEGVQVWDNLYEKAEKLNMSMLEYLASIQREKLSDGIEQRLVIARILYRLTDVDLLLFDEPISAIDKNTAVKIIGFIKKYCNRDKKRYVLLATHQHEWIDNLYVDEKITFNKLSQTQSEVE